MIEGFAARLQQEVSRLAVGNVSIKVCAPEYRQQAVWQGASIFASTDMFADMWVTKEEYEQSGAKVVHRKCL